MDKQAEKDFNKAKKRWEREKAKLSKRSVKFLETTAAKLTKLADKAAIDGSHPDVDKLSQISTRIDDHVNELEGFDLEPIASDFETSSDGGF